MKSRTLFLSALLFVTLHAAEPSLLPRDRLLLRHDAGGTTLAVRTPADWLERRAEIVRSLETVMGPFPGATSTKRVPLDVQIEEEIDHDTYVVRRISYVSEPGSRTPAYLCIPKRALNTGARALPAVLCLHPTDTQTGVGVIVGLGTSRYPAYASELAARGYVTLAPAYPLLAGYAPDLAALGYASGTMKAIWDNTRALDVLAALPYVKHAGYGVIGHSLGGHNAVFTTVFEPRLVAIAVSCGFDSFLDYNGGKSALWAPGKGWCQERYMPRLVGYAGELAAIPFDFHGLLAALAPRAVLINAPLRDANFQSQSVDRVVASAREIYALYGATAQLRVEHPDCEHDFPTAQRETAFQLFDSVLK